MTGFGKAVTEYNGDVITAEFSAVNHRYLDCSVRTPYAWAALEPVIKQRVRDRLGRGKIQITLNRKRSGGVHRLVLFDKEMASQYVAAFEELNTLTGTKEPISLTTLAQMDGVLYQEDAEEDVEQIKDIVNAVVDDGLAQLDAMRATEGAALAKDLRERIEGMAQSLASIEGQLPRISEEYEKRLRSRIDDLKADTNVTEERIALEVAVLAEKADVTEEVVRFKTHLAHFLELLGQDEPVGRQLDFLSQELQREVNTLGVKTRDSGTTKEVLALRGELEKVREQVQNIE
jgi:uncharacterized protein (TIGR00255 family)